MIVFLDSVIVIYLIEGPDAFRSKSWPERGRGREQVRRGAVSVTWAGTPVWARFPPPVPKLRRWVLCSAIAFRRDLPPQVRNARCKDGLQRLCSNANHELARPSESSERPRSSPLRRSLTFRDSVGLLNLFFRG
jgi:hypothetical protein